MVDFASNCAEPQLGVAILGVPFDSLTLAQAADEVERMIRSSQPHYLVTANVDFLVQAREDIELRRILINSDLVLCDGTPLVWASRLLGNALPERCAGADLVPHLIALAAQRKYRLFFLGATPESGRLASEKLHRMYPGLETEFYSPPFKPLLEMDHREISRRIGEARPDILFVALGCPKQEKWMAMHYRNLGVPVMIGVGATVDFLAGQVRRAPKWMQRSGTEWLFRLAQEPGRLFQRYARDLWVFALAIWGQMRRLARVRAQGTRSNPLDIGQTPARALRIEVHTEWLWVLLPIRFDIDFLRTAPAALEKLIQSGLPVVLDFREVESIDSTAIAWLLKLEKRTRATAQHLILVGMSEKVESILSEMRVESFFVSVPDMESAVFLIGAASRLQGDKVWVKKDTTAQNISWHGEITAENSAAVLESTCEGLLTLSGPVWQIDCSDLHFIDSTGLALLLKLKQWAQEQDKECEFTGVLPAVRNVLEFGRCTNLLQRSSSQPAPQHERRHAAGAPVS